ncbi:hypothetical protein GCM10007049_07310 [Echinicola pacifica]|uniref:Uncharacterized protein n=1 Tax=Echinicola pacifica TaxID=346377 RepID=A0A918PNZ4_9BACT|nr:hypothetical protein [Echinicola pacifica]GGZ17358.1 hypothetical protein GCM10007049_07310 [Echinicola pacifica]
MLHLTLFNRPKASNSQYWKAFIIVSIGMLLYQPAMAQDEDLFGIDTKATKTRRSNSGLGNISRGIISKISLEMSTGYGLHYDDMAFQASMPETYPIIPIQEGLGAISPNEIKDFSSSGHVVPIEAGLRIDIFGILSVGGGYGRDFGKIKTLENPEYQFTLTSDKLVTDRFFGTVGLVLWDAQRRRQFLAMKYKKFDSNNLYMQAEQKIRMRQDYPWRVIIEGEFGSLTIKDGDPALAATEPYYSFGLRIEREFSEYTKMFIKPNASFRKYDYINSRLEEVQTINQNLFMVNIGVALRLPGTKRCKFPGCGVKMKHLHDGVEYRGSSIWEMQNRKVGQWY